MLNSTKTWQERFDDIFGENHHKICIGKNCECHKVVKQFISDLRKKDEQQLLLKLSLETQYYGKEIEMKISKIIEEYYVKN